LSQQPTNTFLWSRDALNRIEGRDFQPAFGDDCTGKIVGTGHSIDDFRLLFSATEDGYAGTSPSKNCIRGAAHCAASLSSRLGEINP
jgi:hypothetical protein